MGDIYDINRLNCIANEVCTYETLKEVFIGLVEATIASLQNTETKQQVYYQQIHSYLMENYSCDLSLGDVSTALSISKNYINTIICTTVGQSFIQLLTSIRLNAACQYLRENQLAIHDIAHQVGFSSTRYFIQVFKKSMGITPGQYRGNG